VPYSLRLIEDTLAPGARYTPALGSGLGVLYLAAGDIRVEGEGAASATLDPGRARHAGKPGAAVAGASGARVLRFELVRQPPPPAGGRVLLEHPMALDSHGSWLLRCDRVDFERGGIALPHRHRGGGIRCLLRGRLDVTVGEGTVRALRPWDAWFESGREPVLAVSAKDEDTSFIRVSVLPAEIRGKSSMLYVDPADAARSKPRTYTVYVDEPIAL
jgi:quercetin dioxygenase-like cupin family protein